MLTSEQFEQARRLALRLAGIELVDRHREILYHRSAWLGILEGNGLDALLRASEAATHSLEMRSEVFTVETD